MTIKANYIDITNRNIYAACITIENKKIKSIEKINEVCAHYILAGFVDAHIHIESSMLLPSEFAKIAVTHGTVATISDPHEIANVCGLAGVQYMIDNGKKVPFHFHFGAPSCVPATSFETAGATIDSNDIETLLQNKDIYYLSEMMNYPGVLFSDAEVMKKIALAKKYGKPIDGHAPGLMGDDAIKYIQAGITTDHECFSAAEALHKLNNGMKILIREGSAAKNFDALQPLIKEHYPHMMFCCDDKHPDELLEHHINHHVHKALAAGNDLFDVLRMACINPVQHYNMHVGQMQIGDAADCIIVKNIENFEVLQTIIAGEIVFDDGVVNMPSVQEKMINQFHCTNKTEKNFEIKYNHQKTIKVIEAIEGQLITQTYEATPLIKGNLIVSDVTNDVLQIAVVNRYNDAPVANGFIKNFGLQQGAIASTVAHDCHNIIVIGTNTADMKTAVNALIAAKGGISVAQSNDVDALPLPIAGIMSHLSAAEVGKAYQAIDAKAKALGCKLQAPFMTMSFMALLVIPQLKMSDKGLFDGSKFEFVDL
jgi:adenine deaminase